MKKDKKVVTIGMLVAVTVCFFITSIQAQQPFKGTEITVGTFVFESTDALRKLTPEFEKQTGIKVRYDLFPYGDLREKMLVDVVTKTGKYDVLWLDTIWVPEFSKFLYPVTEWVSRDWAELDMFDFPGNFWPHAILWDGEWIGLPMCMCHLGVYCYRKDLFEKYGLNAPRTWKEQFEIARKLTLDLDGNGKIDVYGTAHRYLRGNQIVSDWFHYTGCYASYESKWGGGLFDLNLKPVFDSPDLVKAAKDYFGFHWQGFTPPGSETFEFADIIDWFTSGKVATIVTENWACASLIDPEKSKVWDKVAFALPPGYEYEPGKVRDAYYAGGAFPWSISKFSKNKEAAWQFIKWGFKKETQKKLIPLGSTEFRLSTFRDPELAKDRPWLPPMEMVAKLHFYRPLFVEYPKYEEYAGIALSRALMKEIPVQEALAWAAERMYEVMEKGGYYK
jgi:multiple sugar transport system substrate-binding protein